MTYGSRGASPTIDDVGEVDVVQGVARVALDPAFAATVDFRRPYFVFVTPEGDSNGFYVAQKTPKRFLVRESRLGHSTLRVQYRIVAKPLDESEARLPLVASSLLATDAKVASHVLKVKSRNAAALKLFDQIRQRHPKPQRPLH